MTKIIPFIDCMESYRKSNQAGEIVKLNPIYLQKSSLLQTCFAQIQCAKETGIIYGPIKRCTDSGQGSALHLANGKMTKALTPTLTFVPWIIINGVKIVKNIKNQLINITLKPLISLQG